MTEDPADAFALLRAGFYVIASVSEGGDTARAIDELSAVLAPDEETTPDPAERRVAGMLAVTLGTAHAADYIAGHLRDQLAAEAEQDGRPVPTVGQVIAGVWAHVQQAGELIALDQALDTAAGDPPPPEAESLP